LVTLAAACCAYGHYHDLHRAMGATAFLWALLFAVVPAPFLAALFVWIGRLRPEPRWLMTVAWLWGALGATYVSLKLNGWLAGLIGDVYNASARSAVFVAPWVEEAAKAAVIFAIVIWRRHDFNAVVAGVTYGGLAGVGFAFTENIVYYGPLFQRVHDSNDTGTALHSVEHLFLWRGIATPFVHPMFTMLTGIGIGLAVRYRHVGVRILAPVAGYCAAVLLHMGYNALASFAVSKALTAAYVLILLPTLVAVLGVALTLRWHERKVIAARLADYAAFGWIGLDQIGYIVSARGRRAARRYAKPFGAAERTRVREFQRVGVDLGAMRDRVVRGVAGASELGRERDLVAALRTVRRQVLLPSANEPRTGELTRASSSW
jgi:protease PrsW